MNGEHAGHPLDHHFPDVVLGLADERDPRASVTRHIPHPFGARTGFPRAAPAEDQPGAPVGFGRALMVVGIKIPPAVDGAKLVRLTFRYQLHLFAQR